MTSAQQISFIRDTFGLTQKELAKALNVGPHTVGRWETGRNEPTGLQSEVIRGLHRTASEIDLKKDKQQADLVGGLIALGIGALIFYLLTRQ